MATAIASSKAAANELQPQEADPQPNAPRGEKGLFRYAPEAFSPRNTYLPSLLLVPFCSALDSQLGRRCAARLPQPFQEIVWTCSSPRRQVNVMIATVFVMMDNPLQPLAFVARHYARTRSRRNDSSARAAPTAAESISAIRMVSFSPALATMFPQGSTTWLRPMKPLPLPPPAQPQDRK